MLNWGDPFHRLWSLDAMALSHFPQPTLPQWQLNSCHGNHVTMGVEWANTPVIRFRCTLKRPHGCNELRDPPPVWPLVVCVCVALGCSIR